MTEFIVHARFIVKTADGWDASSVQQCVYDRLTTNDPITDSVLGIDVTLAPPKQDK